MCLCLHLAFFSCYHRIYDSVRSYLGQLSNTRLGSVKRGAGRLTRRVPCDPGQPVSPTTTSVVYHHSSGQQINNLRALPDTCARPRCCDSSSCVWINFLGVGGFCAQRQQEIDSFQPQKRWTPEAVSSHPCPVLRPTCCPAAVRWSYGMQEAR